MLEFDEHRELYGRVLVDLREPRWDFMNTQFSLSAASLYAHAVELLDARRLEGVLSYGQLYRIIRAALDEEHLLGALKPEIMDGPEAFVDLDPDLPLALLDLRHAGKKLLLITNSSWEYTQAMMTYACDQFLPDCNSWRSLFDMVIVSARKPRFFSIESPVYEVVGAGLLRPQHRRLEVGKIYEGGHAGMVEEALGLSGAEILYVGDHIFADVTASKSMLRWRTALVVGELAREIQASEAFRPRERELAALMEEKERLDHSQAVLRLEQQRLEAGYGPSGPAASADEIGDRLQSLRTELLELDGRIAPLAKAASELGNVRWGPLMRAGNDKSHFARQVEQNADIYMSGVSSLLGHTPFAFLRAPRGSLPHDPGSG
jgi:HAD superfamily 5'-nucleotidase-like hydrolase